MEEDELDCCTSTKAARRGSITRVGSGFGQCFQGGDKFVWDLKRTRGLLYWPEQMLLCVFVRDNYCSVPVSLGRL